MSTVISKATTRSFTAPNRTTDFTGAIERMPNMHSFIKEMGVFRTTGTSQLSVTFDEIFRKRAIHSSTKRGGKPVYGSDRKTNTHALALPYWKFMDEITGADVQSYREAGSADQTTAVATAVNRKLEDLRGTVDELHEFLMFSAMSGKTLDADGTTIFDAFTEFDVTQDSVDFQLSNADVDLDGAFDEVLQTIQENKSTTANGVDIFVDSAWYRALKNNDKFRETYKHYRGEQNPDMLRGNHNTFYQFGVVGMLTLQEGAIRIFNYNPEFLVEQADGTFTTTKVIAAGQGFAVPRGAQDMFIGWYGPQDSLSGANSVGREMFAEVYRDPRDKFVEVGVESAPLFINADPAATILITQS